MSCHVKCSTKIIWKTVVWMTTILPMEDVAKKINILKFRPWNVNKLVKIGVLNMATISVLNALIPLLTFLMDIAVKWDIIMMGINVC